MEVETEVPRARAEKKKRFPRPSSFIKRRSSIKLRLSIKPNKSKENLEHIDLGSEESPHVFEEVDNHFEQCKRLKNELDTSNDKVGQFETEVNLLRSQLRSVYRKELKANETVLSDTEVDYDLLTNEAKTTEDDIGQNIGPKAYSDGEQDPSEHHSRPCKECEKLLLTRVSALVEAITLRKYVLQMSKINDHGGSGAEAFLSENERKLTKTLAEKELLARQFKSVCRERDKILLERDRALEEWEKAASKWETTLDQLDTLMIQQNEAKERDNKTISRLRAAITELESTVKEKEQTNNELQQRCIQMENQLSSSKKEASDCLNEHDAVLKANYNIAQELRRVNGELKETQAKCTGLEDSVQKSQTLLERSKATNEHIVKQWKYAVKEKKKLQRDISNIVMSRDEAIQRNLSTLSQLDRVKDERDRLSRRVRSVDQNENYSEASDAQCLADCQFCTESSYSPAGTVARYDQITVSIARSDLPELDLYLAPAIISGHNTVMVTKVDDRLTKRYNIRKYDDIVSVNQESVVGDNVEKVKKLLEESETDLNLTLRRYKTPCEITFETEVPIPKRSKLGCGVHWGVYIKDLASGLAKESGNVEMGDYINTINGKNLSKILSSALDKYSKRGEKMCMEITRKLSPSVWKCPCHYTAMRNNNVTLRDKYPNRDSVISVESNHSFAASSISSIPSYISSIDSASVCSPMTASESEGHSKTDRRFDSYGMETGVPPTIAEESSTDDSVFYSTKNRRVRSLNHLGKPKLMKKGTLTRAQSLNHSLNSDDGSLRPRSTSRSSGTICSNGSIVSVKKIRPVSAATPVTFTVPVSKERSRVVRLDKRSDERLGMKISGGNCVGIYVTGFLKQSLAEEAGVRIGDRLLQLNSYTVSQVSLDYATRILRMLRNCNYIRMEVQNYTNVDDVLKEGKLDSLYVRARVSHIAKSPTELSYSIGDKLRVTNTRANYDPVNETWQWYAVRERLAQDGGKREGLIAAMNYSPELDGPSSQIKTSPTTRESEGDDASVLSDDSSKNNFRRSRRNSVESLSKLRRYRAPKWRSSVESLGSETDSQAEQKTTSYYEILQEKEV